MFNGVTFAGQPLGSEYARIRSSIEPIVEVTQIKGDSETFPTVSPNDEFADFENWTNFAKPQTDTEARQSYVRSALQTGLALGAELGVNPYKFGMIGSTDSHTGLATADEDNFWGKMGSSPNPAPTALGRKLSTHPPVMPQSGPPRTPAMPSLPP